MSSLRIAFQTLLRSSSFLTPVVQTRTVQTTSAVFAGHSKWQNIKHTKAGKDAQKSQLYNRLIMKIYQALQKQGGNDPRLNKDFGDVIEMCRKANMPNSTIDKAIKRATEKKYYPLKIEIIGPENSLMVIDAEVDNRGGFKNDVRKILKKFVGFGFANEGRALSAFQEKGVVRVRNKEESANFDLEKMEEIAIEADAEEVQISDEDDTVLMFIGDATSYTRVKAHLEDAHPDEFTIVEHGAEFVPYQRLDVGEATMQILATAMDEVGALEGVNRVYTNV